jgi:NAD(P)H-dependent FMN reductase
MTKIGIIVGSTRPCRRGRAVVKWVAAAAREHPDPDFEIVDLADYVPPLLDEDQPARFRQYGNPHTVRWAKAIARCDGFVFVAPEYDHSIPGR